MAAANSESYQGGHEVQMMFQPLSRSCQIHTLNEIYAMYFQADHGTFVEVGANDGESWSNTWHLAVGGWRGLYFEPIAELANKCKEKHKDNNVSVVQSCVGDHDGMTKLFLGSGATTSAYVAKNDTFYYGHSAERFMLAPVVTLNTALEEYNINNDFELLVIDVDGDELGVLAGLDLEKWSPFMIIIETCKHHPDLTWRFNAKAIDDVLREKYEEIYSDTINSIYICKGYK